MHELTHIFEFDIVPQSLIRETVPLWVAEGLSDYMTGVWRPIDLMTVRDAAVTDREGAHPVGGDVGDRGDPNELRHTLLAKMAKRRGKTGGVSREPGLRPITPGRGR